MAEPNSLTSLESILAELTPNPETFANLDNPEESIYTPEDIHNDMEYLSDFKKSPNYKMLGERSDAKLLEKTFTDLVERGDWFGEYDLYADDDEFMALITSPTTEIDDVFNHIDVISLINNETTGHKIIPFAIDLTYNTDPDKISKKFHWWHAYGKKAGAPENTSEFALETKFKRGLKIPGFASAKYYEDKNNIPENSLLKGRIQIMPRFIVGYSPDLADTLATGKPTEEFRWKHGNAAYTQEEKKFEIAQMRAKWCTLLECSKQASDIRSMLENMSAEKAKWMNPEELEVAKKQIVAMDEYFKKALEIAEQKAKINTDELDAKKYAEERDHVCELIRLHSDLTFASK